MSSIEEEYERLHNEIKNNAEEIRKINHDNNSKLDKKEAECLDNRDKYKYEEDIKVSENNYLEEKKKLENNLKLNLSKLENEKIENKDKTQVKIDKINADKKNKIMKMKKRKKELKIHFY